MAKRKYPYGKFNFETGKMDKRTIHPLKCVAIDPKSKGYTDAIIDDCSKIKGRLKFYKDKLGEKNIGKKIFKLKK